MNNPVVELLITWGVPILILMVIGEIAIIMSEAERIKYRGKTFVKKFKDECDKVNRGEK